MWYLLALLAISALIPMAEAQIPIQVNQTQPCFLNYTAGVELWQKCGFGDDYIQFAINPWMWISGGYFVVGLISILVMFSYIKYHKASYPLIIGTVLLPISFALFPETWLNQAMIMAFLYICIMLWHIFIHKTKEYNG